MSVLSRFLIVFLIIGLLNAGFLPAPARGATILYKSYLVRQARGLDILCDPYIVMKNDSVSKLILKRGEMAEADFPEFLDIFKQINPGVTDLDHIRVGQHIFIPIKKLKKNSLPGQITGQVTISFVTISKIRKVLRDNSELYTVEKGDMVSVLVSRRWVSGGQKQSFRDGMTLFKRANPSIANLDHIVAGQRVYIPKPDLIKHPLYPSLLTGSPDLNRPIIPPGLKSFTAAGEEAAIASTGKGRRRSPASNLTLAAEALDARLLTRGVYHFPRTGQPDFKLDLSRSHVMKFKDGRSVIITGRPDGLPDLGIIQPFWKQVTGIYLPSQAGLDLILDRLSEVVPTLSLDKQITRHSHGLVLRAHARWVVEPVSLNPKGPSAMLLSAGMPGDEQLPERVVKYLSDQGIVLKELIPGKGVQTNRGKKNKTGTDTVTRIYDLDPRTVIKKVLLAMGYKYAEQVPITFPYAGVQIRAAANVITKPNGNLLLVDFEDLLGDAVQAIRDSYLQIVQLSVREGFEANIRKLLHELDNQVSENPTILISKPEQGYTVSVTLSGLLIQPGGETEYLLTSGAVSDAVIRCLARPGTRVITIRPDLNGAFG